MAHLVLLVYRKRRKCMKCNKKKPVVITALYDHETDDLEIGLFCKNCFREVASEYTLEDKCIVCRKNFKCNVQTTLFSKEEIKAYKKQFWG